MGFSNLTLTPERLENIRLDLRPKYESAIVSLIVSKGGKKSRPKAIHVARYDINPRTGYHQWFPLCSSRMEDVSMSLTGTLDDVSCLRCEPLISIVEGIELFDGECSVQECPIPLM